MTLYGERQNLATKIYALDMLGGQCVKCGQTNIFALQFDHIKPTRMSRGRVLTSGGFVSGGPHMPALILNGHEDLSNLQILCASCHMIKTYYEGPK